MVIANPISDTVFKWLMEDPRIARFFIETLLEETVTEVVVKPQEFTYNKDGEQILAASFAIFRLDFVATIKTTNGEFKKVLIELQKARNATDIMRFRNYLGKHYMRKEEVSTPEGTLQVPLPIISIYLIGFKLPEITTPVVKVSRQYIDQISHEVINEKNDFIEKLTHDSYVVQIPRIEKKLQTRLEQTLSFFEQDYYIDEAGMIKEYPYPITDNNIRLIADALHYAGTDPEKRKMLETEIEALRVYYDTQKELQDMVIATSKALEAEKRASEEKDKALEVEKRANEEKDRALKEKEKALEAALKEIEALKNKGN